MPTDDVIDLVELRQELIRPGGALADRIDLMAGDRLDERRSGGSRPARRSFRHRADHRLPVGGPRPPGPYLDCAARLWHRHVHPGAAGRYRSRVAGRWLSLLAGLAVSRRHPAYGRHCPAVLRVAQRRACCGAQGLRHPLRASRHLARPSLHVVGIGINVGLDEEPAAGAECYVAWRLLRGSSGASASIAYGGHCHSARRIRAPRTADGRRRPGMTPLLAAAYAGALRRRSVARFAVLLSEQRRRGETSPTASMRTADSSVRTDSGRSVYGAGDVVHLQS